jgi:hypothetical protein
MNALLARNFSKGGHSIIRSFSGGAIPTSSTLQSGAYKVVGLDHLSVSGVIDCSHQLRAMTVR